MQAVIYVDVYEDAVNITRSNELGIGKGLILLNNHTRQRGGGILSKDTYIRIRLTAEQKEQIKEAAKRNKTNMSDFVLTATKNTILKGVK